MSLKDLKSKSDQALASIQTSKPEQSARPARPMTAPGATAFMQPAMDALNERAKTAEAKLLEREQQLANQPTEVPLQSLVEVTTRKRRLTDDQFEELKANLANNPLIHPVAVRRLADGRFELLSGYNRAAAFRALGRSTIPITVVEVDDTAVERSAFYANLLQPSLPDFEKFQGFRRERDRTGASQKALAREAGVSEGMLSMLFSFETLPPLALEAIAERPESVGMNCAAELAKLTKDGRAEAVSEAVRLLVAGQLSQKEAVSYAARRVPAAREEGVVSPPVKIKFGRAIYCEYVARGPTLRIAFKSEAQRVAAEEGIASVLRTMAERGLEDS